MPMPMATTAATTAMACGRAGGRETTKIKGAASVRVGDGGDWLFWGVSAASIPMVEHATHRVSGKTTEKGPPISVVLTTAKNYNGISGMSGANGGTLGRKAKEGLPL